MAKRKRTSPPSCERIAQSSVNCENIHNLNSCCEFFHNASPPCDISHNPKDSCEKKLLRFNRAIAASGYCSRRKADELILAGKVCLNGKIESNPATLIAKDDQISINGISLRRTAPLTYLIYKPVQTICTTSDPQRRRTVLDLLPLELKNARLFPVGRLDYFSEGLLLLTNDGDLAFCLTHPSRHVAKIYEVTIRDSISDIALRDFRSGMLLPEGKQLQPVPTAVRQLPDGNTLLILELREGFNRQIRKMCAKHDLAVLKLKRIKQGSLALGSLKPGQYRKLSDSEIEKLKSDCSQLSSPPHA